MANRRPDVENVYLQQQAQTARPYAPAGTGRAKLPAGSVIQSRSTSRAPSWAQHTALHPAPPRLDGIQHRCLWVWRSGGTAMPLKSPVFPRGHGARAPPRPRLGILRGFHPQVLAHLLASWAEHALRAKARRGARRGRLVARDGRAGTGARQGHSQVAVCAAPDHGGGRRDGRYGQGIYARA